MRRIFFYSELSSNSRKKAVEDITFFFKKILLIQHVGKLPERFISKYCHLCDGTLLFIRGVSFISYGAIKKSNLFRPVRDIELTGLKEGKHLYEFIELPSLYEKTIARKEFAHEQSRKPLPEKDTPKISKYLFYPSGALVYQIHPSGDFWALSVDMLPAKDSYPQFLSS